MRKRVGAMVAAAVLWLMAVLPAGAARAGYELLMDEADLLTAEEADALVDTLQEISDRQNMDVVVVTIYSLDGKQPRDFADDYFDDNGYGQGSDRSGVLLLHSPEERDWWISTRGYGITAFTDAGIEYIGEQITPYLADGDNAKAYRTFADWCDRFITQARTGKPYDKGNLPRGSMPLYAIPLSLAVGLILALVTVRAMKQALQTVRSRTEADIYCRRDSMQMEESRDTFLYCHVTRTAKPKTERAGGSSVHTSSSGSSHGGGGGKY